MVLANVPQQLLLGEEAKGMGLAVVVRLRRRFHVTSLMCAQITLGLERLTATRPVTGPIAHARVNRHVIDQTTFRWKHLGAALPGTGKGTLVPMESLMGLHDMKSREFLAARVSTCSWARFM